MTQILTASDFYKTDHRRQYPPNTGMVYSNMTARKSMLPGVTHTVFFGLQGFVAEFLIQEFNAKFFSIDKAAAVKNYKRRLDNALGAGAVPVDHVEALHDLGYLPIRIKAVPEGTLVPMRVPYFTIVNTKPEFYWLTNFLETLISCETWKPITNATIAREYKKLISKYADETVGNRNFVPWQGHDFSMRGMSGLRDAAKCGAAHLLSFTGTDTIPAIDYAEEYYGADSDAELLGGSVPASEHSVMSLSTQNFTRLANGDFAEGEFLQFKHLIAEVYPAGIVSIVSDTYDLWQVLTKFLPRLKDDILARNGKVVIRPDSGDPVKIICGDPNAPEGSPEHKGVVRVLAELFGAERTEKGFCTLNGHIGVIYGDSITLERANNILEGLKQNGFSSDNIVFGIGSFTYNYTTRDVLGMAVKSTYGEVAGEGMAIYKDPKTDDGTKKSAKGLLCVTNNGDLVCTDCCTWEQEQSGELQTVFEDGKLIRFQTFKEIREHLNAYPI